MITIQEALRELNKRPLRENTNVKTSNLKLREAAESYISDAIKEVQTKIFDPMGVNPIGYAVLKQTADDGYEFENLVHYLKKSDFEKLYNSSEDVEEMSSNLKDNQYFDTVLPYFQLDRGTYVLGRPAITFYCKDLSDYEDIDEDLGRDYKLKTEGFNDIVDKEDLEESKVDAEDCLHDACLKLDIDYDTIGYTEDGRGYIIGTNYTDQNVKDIVDFCKESIKEGKLEKLIKDNDSMIFIFNNKKKDIKTEGFNSIVKEEDLKEDLSTFNSLPVELLSETEVKDYIENIPEARPNRPPVFFKLGYIKDMVKDIAAKYRGGRGAGDNPKVKIVKCIEYSKLYTGLPYTATNATKKADKVLGTERHTGERSGFNYEGEGNVENRIGSYRNGKLALQAYIADSSNQKVKYFISIDDGELQEISRYEVAEYLTPTAANKVKNGSQRKAAGIDAQGNELYDKDINRFPLNGIYMIGNLGHSVF